MSRTALVALALLPAFLAGCAATAPSTPSTPSTLPPAPVGEPAPQARPAQRAKLNLSGFPAPYQDGYTAGCDSKRDGSKRREEGRYKADTNYKMGWDDGFSICGSRK